EVSRLDEVSDSKPLSIQVIDNAVIPLHKSAPKRLLIIIISIILSLVFASLYYIFMNYSKYSNKN
ncbi:MAG TPA: GNVR domain-containing protein, partial [Burkholderiales bacterium]|nr:GNVR domain-containing protein [Burkholderiales bacterium]